MLQNYCRKHKLQPPAYKTTYTEKEETRQHIQTALVEVCGTGYLGDPATSKKGANESAASTAYKALMMDVVNLHPSNKDDLALEIQADDSCDGDDSGRTAYGGDGGRGQYLGCNDGRERDRVGRKDGDEFDYRSYRWNGGGKMYGIWKPHHNDSRGDQLDRDLISNGARDEGRDDRGHGRGRGRGRGHGRGCGYYNRDQSRNHDRDGVHGCGQRKNGFGRGIMGLDI